MGIVAQGIELRQALVLRQVKRVYGCNVLGGVALHAGRRGAQRQQGKHEAPARQGWGLASAGPGGKARQPVAANKGRQ